MTNIFNEQWRDIPGFLDFYKISSFGRVISKERIIITKKGIFRKIDEKILKPQLDTRGYFRFYASVGSKVKAIYLHQAIAWAFLGKQEKGMEVRHLDGNSINNTLQNLAYGTKSQNIADAKIHGTFPLYERRPGAKLTRKQAIEICESKEPANKLAARFGINVGTIRQIRIGETWTEFTQEVRAKNPFKFRRKFTKEERIDICDRSKSRQYFCKKYSTSIHIIKRIRKDRNKMRIV